MRVHDIIAEGVDIRPLIERVSQAIPEVLHKYVTDTIRSWKFSQRYQYKKENGTEPPEFWTGDFDYITDNLGELIQVGKNGPIYGAMTMTGRAITKITQEYIREKFGDPVIIYNPNPVTVPVDKIKVEVWWHAREGEHYSGIFRARAGHANGTETRLEVIADPHAWRDFLIEAFIGELSGEGSVYDEFSENIVNTFAHEYAHLEQNLKGAKNYTFSLIPHQKYGRNSDWVKAGQEEMTPEQSFYYHARPAEIDAFATGAAAQAAERVARNFQIDARRWDASPWNIQKVPDDQWNAAIQDQLSRGIHGLGSSEYVDYVYDINKELANTDPVVKAKYLELVKRRFLSTYYRRLSSYLRPVTSTGIRPAS